MAQGDFKNLFTPFKTSWLELKNRISMLPVTTGFNEPDQTVGDRFRSFYTERARGGAGLISVPFAPVNTGGPFEPGIYDDRFIPGARRLTESIHSFGAKVFAEFIISYHVLFDKGPSEVVGPSAVWNSVTGCMPRPLTTGEIDFIAERHGRAALRAVESGFDAIELHLGAGYLLGRFLSPLRNVRTDRYGGNPERRMQIVLDCIKAMRDAAPDFPVTARVTVDELVEGGRKIEDTRPILEMLENAGIRMITFHIGAHESKVPTIQPCVSKGGFAHLAARIKGWTRVPVIAANRINDPFIAERILAEGQADIAGMGRALIADPELPNKSLEGKTDEIIPCIACSNCLSAIAKAFRQWSMPVRIDCKVNPLVGREGEHFAETAAKKKKVMVIGGGPAGLEAARAAAKIGHEVVLYEKEKQCGGRLLAGALPPYKEDITTLHTNMTARAKAAGVEILSGVEATRETVEAEKPDALIVAAGARPFHPPIPGIRGDNVVFAVDILSGAGKTGAKVLIIGGGMVGCETAEFIVANSKGPVDVTVLEMLARPAQDLSTNYRPFFLKRLKEAGIKLVTGARVEEITQSGAKVGREGAIEEFYEGDTIVLALGLKPDTRFVEELKEMVPESYAVGDCSAPGSIREAIEQGFSVGNSI